MTVAPADIRAYANLPSEVPEAFLASHVEIGGRELARASGLEAAPDPAAAAWREAHIVRALASALPFLNTFALSGAAKVGRLEGAIEARFLDAQEVGKLVDRLMRRFGELLGEIGEAATAEGGGAAVGSITMFTIQEAD